MLRLLSFNTAVSSLPPLSVLGALVLARQLLRRWRRAPVRESDRLHQQHVELLRVIVLLFAIVFMFGRMVGRSRQAHAIVAVLLALAVAEGMSDKSRVTAQPSPAESC